MYLLTLLYDVGYNMMVIVISKDEVNCKWEDIFIGSCYSLLYLIIVSFYLVILSFLNNLKSVLLNMLLIYCHFGHHVVSFWEVILTFPIMMLPLI
jgi:hypothetical protein